MRPASPPRPLIRARVAKGWRGILLAAWLVGSGSVLVMAGEDEAAPLSPFEGQRARHAAQASGGAEGCAAARADLAAGEPTRRLHAWRTLASARVPVDLEVALSGARDTDARVAAVAAGEVWRALARPRAGALLPDPATESHATQQALTFALRRRLAQTPVGSRPLALFLAGPHAAHYLERVLFLKDTEIVLRERIVAWLPRLGSERAADVLLRGLERGSTRLAPRLLYGALAGISLTEAQRDRLITLLEHPVGGPRIPLSERLAVRGWSRGRDVESLLALLGRHGSADLDPVLIEACRAIYARGRTWPPRLLAATRVLADRDALRLADLKVLLDRCDSRIELRGREVELGGLLMLSESRWQDEAAQVLLHDMLERTAVEESSSAGFTRALTPTVEAWARFLVGEPPEDLEPLVRRLVFGTGREIPLWSARHLGTRLWRRLAPPKPDEVRELLQDPDGWMRREALAWTGELTTEARDAAIVTAVEDPDDRVFFAGLDLTRAPLGARARGRALELALTGREEQRLRAWKALHRLAWPSALAGRGGFEVEPDPAERVALAAAFFAEGGKGPGEGLPEAGDR